MLGHPLRYTDIETLMIHNYEFYEGQWKVDLTTRPKLIGDLFAAHMYASLLLDCGIGELWFLADGATAADTI